MNALTVLELEPGETPLQFAVRVGMFGLVTLNMPRTPDADDLDVTRAAWEGVLRGAGFDDSPEDVQRINQGFLNLAARTVFWPLPVNLLACMPERERLKWTAAEIAQHNERMLYFHEEVFDAAGEKDTAAEALRRLNANCEQGPPRPDRAARKRLARVALRAFVANQRVVCDEDPS